jgi:hypothetical protein
VEKTPTVEQTNGTRGNAGDKPGVAPLPVACSCRVQNVNPFNVPGGFFVFLLVFLGLNRRRRR